MGILAHSIRERFHRWWGRLQTVGLRSDGDPKAAGLELPRELLAYAMGPELISLAALMALAEDAAPETSRGPLFAATE